MKQFNYEVNAHFAKAETTLRTNDITVALGEFFEYVEDGVHCDIVNGFTGEVLAIANNPNDEDYATDEMALMMLGHMMAEAWGEDEGEDEETCPTCGGEVVDGVCQYCGNCIECEHDDPAVALLSALFGISADQVVALHNGEGLPS